MGVKNLMIIIKKYAPNSITQNRISKYANSVFAIDANLMLYRMVFGVRKTGVDIMNGETVVTHIHTLLLKLLAFRKYNITPIFVFDGKSPNIKSITMAKRKLHTKQMIAKYTEITDDMNTSEKNKYFLRKTELTSGQINECRKLIELFGCQIINSKGEADIVCALLTRQNKADYIVTDDMDVLLFGGDKILKNFTTNDKKTFQQIDRSPMLDALGITQKQLVELGILLGTDYNPTVRIGTIGAYKNILKHGNIQNILVDRDMELDFDYNVVCKYYTNINKIKYTIDKHKMSVDGLCSFLRLVNFNEEYVKVVMGKLFPK